MSRLLHLIQNFYRNRRAGGSRRLHLIFFGCSVSPVRNKLHLRDLSSIYLNRTASLGPLPKWQREKSRRSGLDLSRQLRKELLEGPALPAGIALEVTPASILASATT